MQNVICYNEREVKEGQGSKEDIKKGYNLWIDVVNPTESDLFNLQQSFNLDNKALENYENKSKKPQIRLLENHSFTIFLNMKYKSIDNLDTEAVYFFLGRGWLITIHSSNVDLITRVRKMFAEKNKKILESPVDSLYYSILSSIVEKYEQLLTAVELKVMEFEKESLYRPTKRTLENLDILSRQAIVLRRHFWQARHIMNFLTHTEEDKEDIKYLQIVYDDINQLIDLVESYRDTINSVREIYSGSVSLQLNDTMRILTVFSSILLPLTFLTSIFGMQGFDLNNIHSIPQGFTALLIAMAVVSMALFYMFWKRQWISIPGNLHKNKQ
ncbi:MAG TPA: magnesium transporter CorA family protein [Nitrososphaeraceae archaeon]|jgi:magnesium transporter|nr:magnesium transporter CorA family protein [Nitrososphaeraceae archaeon]HZA70959.1 magnesium transporter CorA family protein [Nitrososphaeraceae archaeon]